MANHVKPTTERSTSGISFLVPFLMHFDVAAIPSLQNSFREYCKKNDLLASEILRNRFFKFFDVENSKELLKKNVYIRRGFNTFKQTILDEMGLNSHEFSREWARREIEYLMQNDKH